MTIKSIKDDRQTRTTRLNFDRINVEETYNITEPLKHIREVNNLINNIFIDCYTEIESKYDVESIREIKVDLGQKINKLPYIRLEIVLNTWETKSQMYTRKSDEKRDRQLKEAKLAQEAKLLGFKLEKVNHTPAATNEQCGTY